MPGPNLETQLEREGERCLAANSYREVHSVNVMIWFTAVSYVSHQNGNFDRTYVVDLFV